MEENETWRRDRLAKCRDPNGWLTLVGLHWLEEGEITFGRDDKNTIVFESASAPPRLGKLLVDRKASHQATFFPEAGVAVLHEGKSVTSLLPLLHDEEQGGPTTLHFGTLSWFIVLRNSKLAIRVKDSASPVLAGFTGIDMFPIDLKWRITATFVPYEPPKKIKQPNALGVIEENDSTGAAHFTVDGKPYKVDCTGKPEVKLFVIIADGTTAKETYGGGRYVYSSGPVQDGKVVIDFNQAYNPPCVFTEFATCAYPHADNRLSSLRIEAGEKKYRGKEFIAARV